MTSDLNSQCMKNQLRQQLRARRDAVSVEQAQRCAEAVRDQFIVTDYYKHAERIACYWAIGSELCVQGVIDIIWQQKKICYLPVLQHDKTLQFMEYRPDSQLQNNQYNIPEPVVDHDLLCLPKQLDAVLVPLLGFDREGHRLGMGAGYYDRTFQFLNETSSIQTPSLVGVAYDFQRVDALPVDEWDVKLTTVLSASTK